MQGLQVFQQLPPAGAAAAAARPGRLPNAHATACAQFDRGQRRARPRGRAAQQRTRRWQRQRLVAQLWQAAPRRMRVQQLLVRSAHRRRARPARGPLKKAPDLARLLSWAMGGSVVGA
eukprot:363668-Chlamydomonas_euryale.AAC.5